MYQLIPDRIRSIVTLINTLINRPIAQKIHPLVQTLIQPSTRLAMPLLIHPLRPRLGHRPISLRPIYPTGPICPI